MITDDTADESTKPCNVCGAPIELDDWHIARTSHTATGETEIVVFCSEQCHETWTT